MINKILKKSINLFGLDNFIYNLLRSAIRFEVNRLDVKSSGVDNGIPYIRLNNDLIFYGYLPNRKELYLYKRLNDSTKKKINKECIKVAVDIVLRYKYPHSMPYIQLPHRGIKRHGFHPQHYNTIYDYKISTDYQQELIEKFSIKKDECIVDVGANIGYGALKLSELVGEEGKIIAIEGDPAAFKLLRKNVDANNIKNIICVNKAAYKESKLMHFYTTQRQANSLIKDVIDSENKIPVKADTIPNILSEYSISKVDMISLTINGAEIDALKGIESWLVKPESTPRISLAGWYVVEGEVISSTVKKYLSHFDIKTEIGPSNGLLSWRKV